MNISLRCIVGVVALLVLVASVEPVHSQQQQTGATSGEADDFLTPQDFTEILKEAWTFLKDELEKFRDATKTKKEFETSGEFGQRVAEQRRNLLSRVIKFVNDKQLNDRTLGVLFQATLPSYNADTQIYSVATQLYVELPYNIPGLQTTVAPNQYVAVADSVRRGYRTSSLYLKLDQLRWQVSREEAREAKANESDIDFRVRFRINVSVNEVRGEARITLVPQHIQLVNTKENKVYWEQRL